VSKIGLTVSLFYGVSGLSAQGAPGTNLTVDVSVSGVARSQDTVVVSYSVFNQGASAERLLALTLEAPSPPIQIIAPLPGSSWHLASQYGGRPVVRWGVLGDSILRPGFPAQTVSFKASGVLGIADAHVSGFALPVVEEDTLPSGDPLVFNSVQIKAVGVDPLPPGYTAASLTTRLDSLRSDACSLTWVTSASLCNTLHSYLMAQPANLTQFNADLATNHTTGGSVNDNAYWLLKANADYIISISPPPVNTALINLSYVCGNKFKVRNLNTVAVPLTWNVVNGSETGSVTVPAKSQGGEPGSVFITTIEKRTLRLYYNGQLIATVANGNKPPC